MCNHVAPYRYLFPNMYLSVAYLTNPDFLGCCCRTWISLDIARFYDEQCQPSGGSAWPTCPPQKKPVNRVSIAWGERGRHNLHSAIFFTSSLSFTQLHILPIHSFSIFLISVYCSSLSNIALFLSLFPHFPHGALL